MFKEKFMILAIRERLKEFLEMSFKNVLDLCIVLLCAIDIRLNLPEGIEDGRFAFVFNVIGGMRKAAGIDLFNFHGSGF
jgi:hypothetical protein